MFGTMGDDIEKIITNTLRTLLPLECQRLGVPSSFIQGIYSIFPKPFEYSSLCEPIEQDGKINGVRIRIDTTIRSEGRALRDFWHEMYHAKEYFEGRETHSEAKATLYSWRRYLEKLLHL